MLKLLKQYRRWHDFFNIKEPEVYLSISLTMITLVVANYINLYEEFVDFSATVQNILLYLAAGMLGIMGIALSGVAIITGLFSKKTVETIEKMNEKGIFEKIMSSFLLLAMSCALYAFFAFILVVVIGSKKPVIDIQLFYIIMVAVIYFAIFNILYTVSLVGNCIKIFAIRNKYDEIKEKNFYDIANELRIDYILKGVVGKYGITQTEFLHDLEDLVNVSEINNKEELINYFYRYYTGKTKNK